MAASSPTLPPFTLSCPVYIIPFKNVPVVKIVFMPLTSTPLANKTPYTCLSSERMSTTSPSIISILVSFSFTWMASL